MNFIQFSTLFLVLLVVTMLALIWCYRIMMRHHVQHNTFIEKIERLEQLEYLGRYTNDSICLFDENFNLVAFNDKVLEVYGFTRDEFKQLNLLNFRTNESLSDLKKQFSQLTENNSITYKTVNQRKNGSTFPLEVTARCLSIHNRKYFHTLSHDNTEHKKTLEEMKKLSRAIEQSPTSIVITNINGDIEYVNPKFTELTGYSFDETLGANPRILNAGVTDKQEFVFMWETILTGKEWYGEFQNKKKNGELYVESAVISPIIDESGIITHFVAVKEDITEKKLSYAKLVKAKEKAEESDKLKSAFLSNMSHEIRTPMNAIIGFTEILLKPDLPESKKQRFSALIKQRSFDLLRIIEDILDISRIEIGQMKIIDIEINISHVLKDLYEYYNLKLNKSGTETNLKLKLSIAHSLKNKKIKTDSQRLKQILNNLLDNALKFTESGTIEFGCYLKNDAEILFFVKDTGIGISKQNQKKIFDRFRQVEETLVSRQFGGTGLGLSIAQGIVNLLKGELWVESELGEGTSFFFTLPFRPSQIQNEEEPDVYVENFDKQWDNNTLLIIEDDPGSMEFLHEVLSTTGMNIVKAMTAEDALRQFKIKTNINIVLSDIQLPDINGLILVKLLLDIRPETIVIMQTAYTAPEIYGKCMEAGCKDYITKPMTKEKILSTIQNYLPIPQSLKS